MKTLGKLNINPERIMKHEELVTLRGGYGYVSCRIGATHCGGDYVSNCGSDAASKCNELCSGWDNYVCAGT